VEFQWDEAKAAQNVRDHRVTFFEATTSFLDPFARFMLDEEHSSGQERFILLGRSAEGRLLTTVYTQRGQPVRIISSRRATRREVKEYEEGI
jgi:uncharacterized protein